MQGPHLVRSNRLGPHLIRSTTNPIKSKSKTFSLNRKLINYLRGGGGILGVGEGQTEKSRRNFVQLTKELKKENYCSVNKVDTWIL